MLQISTSYLLIFATSDAVHPSSRALLSNDRLDTLLVDQTKLLATPKEEDELRLLQSYEQSDHVRVQ